MDKRTLEHVLAKEVGRRGHSKTRKARMVEIIMEAQRK
jgi:hypothetical protein